jgi:signal transduction histidine kinase
VINGYAELIEDQSDGQIAELAEGISDKSDHLVNQAEKVRRIEGVISVDQTAPTSLRQTVQRAISSYQTPAHVTIHTSVEDVTVECHPKLYLAVRELIENAIEHDGRDVDPRIEIYSESNEDYVDLVIEDNGPGIPQAEIDVLHAGEETTLQHGSGIGLWLVRWIVTHSNGVLTATATDSGTSVSIQLARASTDGTGERAAGGTRE